MKDFGDNIELKTLTLHTIYKNLLTKAFMPPLIVSKFPARAHAGIHARISTYVLWSN